MTKAKYKYFKRHFRSTSIGVDPDPGEQFFIEKLMPNGVALTDISAIRFFWKIFLIPIIVINGYTVA